MALKEKATERLLQHQLDRGMDALKVNKNKQTNKTQKASHCYGDKIL